MSLMNDALRKKKKEGKHLKQADFLEPQQGQPEGRKLRVYGLVILLFIVGGLGGYFYYEYQSVNQSMVSVVDSPKITPSPVVLPGATQPPAQAAINPVEGQSGKNEPAPPDKIQTAIDTDGVKSDAPHESSRRPDVSQAEPASKTTAPLLPAEKKTTADAAGTTHPPVIEPDGAEPFPVPKKKPREKLPEAAHSPQSTDDPVEERFYRKGLSYHRQNNFELAIQMYQAVLKKDPNHRAARFNLASAYIQVGAYLEAQSILEGLRTSEPYNPEILLNLAVAEIGLDRPGEALELLEKAQGSLSAPSFAIMFHKGAAYSRLGDFEKALAMYQTAERMSSDNPRLPLNKAIAYDHLQRYDQAIEEYEIYLDRNKDLHSPERPSIERRLIELRVYVSNVSNEPAADSATVSGQTE